MTKLFEVEITVRAIVAAEDDIDAISVAYDNRREIVADSYEDCADVVNQIVKGSKLPYGWDEQCHPYGMPATKNIGMILEETE